VGIPSGVPTLLIFRPYVVFSLHKHDFMARSKCGEIKIYEIKYEKNTHAWRSLIAVDPAKRAVKRVRIELTIFDFRTEHCQLSTRLIEFPLLEVTASPLGTWGWQLPFWEHAASPAYARPRSFRFAIGGHGMDGGLTPLGMWYETLFGSPGACLGTPSPGRGGRGIIPLPRVLQVSNYIDTLYIYFTSVGELERAHPGQFRAVFDPPRQGGQNHKNRDCA